MTVPAYSSSTQWYREGHFGSYVRTMKSPSGILDMLEVERPAGDMSRPALPDIVLYQDLLGGDRVSGDLGGGRFDVTSKKGDFALVGPIFATTAIMDASHQLRSLAFPMAQWQKMLDEAADGRFSFDHPHIYGRMFDSPAIREVGYSSNQVLARVFIKYRHMSPSDYRRAVRDPTRPTTSFQATRAALAELETQQ